MSKKSYPGTAAGFQVGGGESKIKKKGTKLTKLQAQRGGAVMPSFPTPPPNCGRPCIPISYYKAT